MKSAKIEYGGDEIPCTIRDLSTALEFSNLAEIGPAAFTLILPYDRLKLPCRVVWRRAFRMGAFD
jgi:hypothetical protein